MSCYVPVQADEVQKPTPEQTGKVAAGSNQPASPDVDVSKVKPLPLDELLVIRHGDLPIVISAPHGGKLAIPGSTPRKGENLETGAAGFRTSRDTGTEELALLVVEELDERLEGSPSCVISRVHRKYVDFNRPPEIGVEDRTARVIYDLYHQTLKDAVAQIRKEHEFGLLIDIHGQGSSKTTVYRGTSNGLTTQGLQNRLGKETQTGPNSLNGLLTKQGWKMHPNPFDAKEQAGFTGGHIVRSFGSHRADGIEAIQLEFGGNYRDAESREQIAEQLADAIVEYTQLYLKLPQHVGK